eukprot:569115-Rhodomonas_salina.1
MEQETAARAPRRAVRGEAAAEEEEREGREEEEEEELGPVRAPPSSLPPSTSLPPTLNLSTF